MNKAASDCSSKIAAWLCKLLTASQPRARLNQQEDHVLAAMLAKLYAAEEAGVCCMLSSGVHHL
jgi:hypothetical protein